MNILTGTHYKPNSSTVTIFYTSFPTADGLKQITESPHKGAKKCEMFKDRYIEKLSLFEHGVTFKFKEPGTNLHGIHKKGYRSFKIHFHPQRLETQIYTLADLCDGAGWSGLSVLEYFSKLLSGINKNDFKKAG